MRTTILILCALAFGACGSDCGTSDSGCKDYQGDPLAAEPYDATPELSIFYGEMFNQVYARIWLHNPTDQEWTADASCVFCLDDWCDYDNPSTHISDVCPHSSVETSLVWGGDMTGAQSASAECEVLWQ